MYIERERERYVCILWYAARQTMQLVPAACSFSSSIATEDFFFFLSNSSFGYFFAWVAAGRTCGQSPY